DRRFPDLTGAGAPFGATSLTLGTAPTSTTTQDFEVVGGALDLLSVLKGSQAISGEVVRTELLKKLMLTVIENAGARWGMLLLEGDRPLVAIVKRSSKKDPGFVTLHESAERSAVEFSRSIVRYVQRTREVVVLGDASADGPFQSDSYVSLRRPKSV